MAQKRAAAVDDALVQLAEAHDALSFRLADLEEAKRPKTAAVDPWSIEAIDAERARAAVFTVQQQLELNQLARQYLFDAPETAPLKQLLRADDKLIDWPGKRVISWNTARALELAHALYYAQNTELICAKREADAAVFRAEAKCKDMERLCFTAAKERDMARAQLEQRADVQQTLQDAKAENALLLKRMQTLLHDAGEATDELVRRAKNNVTAKAKEAGVPGHVIHELVQVILSLITDTKCIHNGIAVDAPRYNAE